MEEALLSSTTQSPTPLCRYSNTRQHPEAAASHAQGVLTVQLHHQWTDMPQQLMPPNTVSDAARNRARSRRVSLYILTP